MLTKDSPDLSVRKQCKILEIARSNFYYKPRKFGFIHSNEFISDSIFVNKIHELWQEYRFMGYRKITAILKIHKGYNVNKKRISRLMQSMNIKAIYVKPNLSKSDASYKYPYLLSDVDIITPNQVWKTDITYFKLKQGFVYLLAVIDVFSRYVVSWKISNNMEIDFCLSALEDALIITKSNILNTDQGSQSTSNKWANTVCLMISRFQWMGKEDGLTKEKCCNLFK
ncbi:MAG: putative transposase [Ulvibacter sp.]|jgi:putative transposase